MMRLRVIGIAGLICVSASAAVNKSESSIDLKGDKYKKEVLDNPTLKAQSGSLNPWSFYSQFSYSGGSLAEPTSAERPNITNADEKPSLTSLRGSFGIKYRANQKDNFSLTFGAYMAAPFHSSFTSDNARVQQEYDENAQELDVDDPRLSYFRTYYIGKVQNLTFVHYEKTTKSISTDYGYHSNVGLNHGAAIRLGKSAYVAGTLSYTQGFFDKDSVDYNGINLNIKDRQVERIYKAGLSFEYYPLQNIAVRAITDVASYFQTRDKDFSEVERRDLQQTIAMSYFYSRDIVIAPKISFIAEDIRSELTNFGISFNVNL